MTQQFTASEVRDAITWKYGDKLTRISAMLTAFADLLEAREKAEPIGWVFQHEETGRMTFCENDGVNNAENFAANNPRHVLCGPAFTHPAPSDAERLAEALRRTCRKMKTFSRTGALDGAVAVWVDEIESVLAAHSAQAQPPAASVTGAVEVSFEVWQDDEMVAECSGPEPSALHEARHYAAQYSQDGAVKLFRVSRVAISAAQENPNG